MTTHVTDDDVWRYMFESEQLTARDHEQFGALHPLQRRQVARGLAEAEVRRLAEGSGLPLRNLDQVDVGGLIKMAESLRPKESTDPLEQMREAGVPITRPPHEVARDLSAAIPLDHPDQDALAPIIRSGAALDGGQRAIVATLESKHAADLAMFRRDDDGADSDVREAATVAMREAGVPMRGRSATEPRDLTPLACLVDAGVPLRPDGNEPMR
jgi:hypothetical protein